MSYTRNIINNAVTVSERRADTVIDIAVMDRYGINLSAARVLQLIERLVKASRQRGKLDKRGIPYCYASKEWMAGQIGKSERTIARAIRDLKAAGLIECKRTRSNAMLFITGYEIHATAEPEQPLIVDEASPSVDKPVASTESEPSVRAELPAAMPPYALENDTHVTSGNDQNGTSNITSKSNIPGTSSIHRSTYHVRVRRVDGRDRYAHLSRKGKDSPTSPPSRERFEADRKRLSRLLWDQLAATGLYIGVLDTDSAIQATVRYIADAVAAKQDIQVNGVSISADQYWEVVSHIKATHLDETVRAIAARDSLGMIRNKRAYLLSSAYNCALWDRFSEVEVDNQAFFRLAESRMEARA